MLLQLKLYLVQQHCQLEKENKWNEKINFCAFMVKLIKFCEIMIRFGIFSRKDHYYRFFFSNQTLNKRLSSNLETH